MNGCIFIHEKQKNICGGNQRYGSYCWKHRKNHLLDSGGNIIIDNFTHISKDYTFKEIKDHYIKQSFEKG